MYRASLTGDEKLDRNLSQIADEIARPRMYGLPATLIEDISFDVAFDNVRVYHGLRRVPIGWAIVKINANANIYLGTSVANLTKDFIELRASNPVTISILVA